MSESDRMESAAYQIDAQAREITTKDTEIARLTTERDALLAACGRFVRYVGSGEGEWSDGERRELGELRAAINNSRATPQGEGA